MLGMALWKLKASVCLPRLPSRAPANHAATTHYAGRTRRRRTARLLLAQPRSAQPSSRLIFVQRRRQIFLFLFLLYCLESLLRYRF